jgi:hypothetical protein
MTEPHNDFVFIPDEPAPPKPPRLGTSRGVIYTGQHFLTDIPIPEGASGEWFAVRIADRLPRDRWKGALGEVPEAVREVAAQWLRERWRVLVNRERLETVGKRSDAGDAVMAELARRYGNG